MSGPGRFWDERFDRPDFVYGTDPNAFLAEQAAALPDKGSVLAVADGEGRNGVWLAEQGFAVTSVDASPVGLRKALKLGVERGVHLTTVCADLTTWDWPQGRFDLVACIFLHLPPDARAVVHARMLQAAKPGGLVILEGFRPEQLAYGTGGPKDEAMLYSPELLRRDFAEADILSLDSVEPDLSEGPFHAGKAATVRLVARRPEV